MAVSGCDLDTPAIDDPTRGAIGPPVQVVRIEATTGYLDGRPSYAPIPEGGVLGDVTRTASIRIHFDRFLLPPKIIRQAVCIRPTLDDVFSIDECVEPFQAFTEPDYSPSRRMVTFRLGLGDRLAAQTRYRVTIFAPAGLDESGFFAFDGAPLARRYVFDFETQAPGGEEVEEALPTEENYCAAVACFEACAEADELCKEACRPLCVEPSCRSEGSILSELTDRATLFAPCATAGCHSPSDPELAPDPSVLAMGLDLYTVTGLAETAVGVTAHQTEHGNTGAETTASGLFGRSMPRIDPNNPGNSYLMYKLLANPLNHPRPDGLIDLDLLTEIDRLRAHFVAGLPMPASGKVPRGIVPLTEDPIGEASFAEMLLIETWIAHGAVTACP